MSSALHWHAEYTKFLDSVFTKLQTKKDQTKKEISNLFRLSGLLNPLTGKLNKSHKMTFSNSVCLSNDSRYSLYQVVTPSHNTHPPIPHLSYSYFHSISPSPPPSSSSFHLALLIIFSFVHSFTLHPPTWQNHLEVLLLTFLVTSISAPHSTWHCSFVFLYLQLTPHVCLM